jgi:L-alanine-DL-glutamate epimerase-like enolase superfamily enzyme
MVRQAGLRMTYSWLTDRSQFAGHGTFAFRDHAFRSVLVDHPLRHVDGRLEIDERPGLGVEVDGEALKRCATG